MAEGFSLLKKACSCKAGELSFSLDAAPPEQETNAASANKKNI